MTEGVENILFKIFSDELFYVRKYEEHSIRISLRKDLFLEPNRKLELIRIDIEHVWENMTLYIFNGSWNKVRYTLTQEENDTARIYAAQSIEFLHDAIMYEEARLRRTLYCDTKEKLSKYRSKLITKKFGI